MPDPAQRRARIYDVFARPRVRVRHDDGQWYPGWLHAWLPDGATGWRAMVAYHVGVGLQHYQDVESERVERADP